MYTKYNIVHSPEIPRPNFFVFVVERATASLIHTCISTTSTFLCPKMPRQRGETSLYRANALLPFLLLLGQGILVRSQTVVGVDSCEDLKSTIEGSGTSEEQLIIQVQEGGSQIVCREGIYVALGQSIRVEGVSNRDVPTELFLDAEGIYDSSGDGSAVGILFENDGDLELYNLAFLLDYVLPEDETTTTTSLDTADNTYGVRVVQNSGAVNMTDCRIAGSRSVANQAYVLGQAVSVGGQQWRSEYVFCYFNLLF